MSISLTDSSAIILIIGAVVVLALVIHGLWFSGRRVNRRLIKGNKGDQELLNLNTIGKVRIVSAVDGSGTHTNDFTVNTAADGAGSAPEGTPPAEAAPVPPPPPEPVPAAPEPVPQPGPQLVPVTPAPQIQPNYEINLVTRGEPFRGEEFAELCKTYGFIRGELDIFYVYENPQQRLHEVFRICSLKPPYSFPEDMQGYTTPALALYMNLPPRGKAAAYFRAMRMAAEILRDRLGGGELEDNYHQPLQAERLDEIYLTLLRYDESAPDEAHP